MAKLGATSYKQAKFLTSDTFITVFGGSAGSGKAQPLTAKVLTPSGWKMMGDIKVGDVVTTPNNGEASVIKVTPFENKPIYRITTESGRVTEACDEHLWTVKVSQRKRKSLQTTITTKEILDQMSIGEKVYLPISEPLGSSKDVDLFINPYLMGILISKGGLTTRSVQFTTADEQIVEKISSIVSTKGFKVNRNCGDSISYRIVKSNLKTVRDSFGRFVVTNEYVDELRNLEMLPYSTYNKFIPKKYLQSSIEQRFELLRGLMDGDGTVGERNTCEYSTSSEQLSKDVVELVRSLGGVARVTSRYPTFTYNGEKKVGALNYRVYIKFNNTSEIFFLDRKKEKCVDRSFEISDKIISIEYLRDDKAQCISIDSEDHLYITDDFIVTHNSQTGLIRFLRYVHDPEFVGYVFRKNATDLKGSGGLFDKAIKLFKQYDQKITYTKQPMRINFPSGASIFFTGLDGQAGMDAIHGIEITCAMIDEATHLSEEEVWWIISRLRTNASGIEPNIWLTCNPDIDSFLFNWVYWYIYPEGHMIDGELVEGRPDKDKNCKIRYYITTDADGIIWGDSKEYFYENYPELTSPTSKLQPESFTFIGATCKDNPLMLENNPKYESNLLKLPRVKKERLYYGNWLAREEEAGYFKRHWLGALFNPMSREDMSYLKRVVKRVRCYDLAVSIPSERYPNPDWTCGVLIARTNTGEFILEDVVRWRKLSGDSIQTIIDVAKDDAKRFGKVMTYLPQDPAQAGVTAKLYQAKLFSQAGVPVKFIKVGTKKSKLTKFEPFTNACENQLVKAVKGEWNDVYFSELESFDGVSKTKKDDQVDATSDSFNVLATTKEYRVVSPIMIN